MAEETPSPEPAPPTDPSTANTAGDTGIPDSLIGVPDPTELETRGADAIRFQTKK